MAAFHPLPAPDEVKGHSAYRIRARRPRSWTAFDPVRPVLGGPVVHRTVARAMGSGLVVTMGLGVLIWIGSRRLAPFAPALAAYPAAILFAAFGLTYRYAVWLQRPPTAMFLRRGWEAFLPRRRLIPNA